MSDWSSDVCSSDLGSYTSIAGPSASRPLFDFGRRSGNLQYAKASQQAAVATYEKTIQIAFREVADALAQRGKIGDQVRAQTARAESAGVAARLSDARFRSGVRSEEHTSELQSLMRISYAVLCLKKKNQRTYTTIN